FCRSWWSISTRCPVPAGAERHLGRTGGRNKIEHRAVCFLRPCERSGVGRRMDRPRILPEQCRYGDGGSPGCATDRLLPRALCALLPLFARPSPSASSSV